MADRSADAVMSSLSASAESGIRHHFVRYTCMMRALGFCTGMLGVAAALNGQGAAATTLLLLFLTCLGWPVLAWRLSSVAGNPLDAEFRNLTIDTGLAGFWIAIAQFDLLPSALLAAVMAMDRTVAGGWALTLRSMAAMAGVALVTTAFNGFAFQPQTQFSTMLWCMPFLTLYLLAIGASTRLFADRVRAQKRLLEQGSRIDAQTGLATRPQWLALVAAELRRFHRYAAVSSLLMVDIDHFKRINDGAGHLAGDQVIGEVCVILRAELRSADTAGRYGGDEFGVLLPGTDREAAMEVAERLRRAVATQVSVDGVPVTLSIGLAQLAPGMEAIEDWTGAADDALYRAKDAGRDCVRD
jgi:diguanylate cyclase